MTLALSFDFGFGLGDEASDMGLSYDQNGVSFDSSKVTSQLPPALKNSASQAFNAWQQYQSGDAEGLYKTSITTFTGVMLTVPVYGWIVGAATVLLAGLVSNFGPGPAVTNYSYPSSYDPGTPGSFENFANSVCREIYDKTFAAPGTGGTLADAEKRMAVGLMTAIRAWNDGHSSSATRVVTLHDANPCSWGFGDPMTVAAGAIVRAAGGPCGKDFSFSINDGPPLAGSSAIPIIPQPSPGPIAVTPARPSSTGKKVLVGTVIVGGVAAGGVALYAAQHGLSLVQSAQQLWSKISSFLPSSKKEQ